MEKITVHADIPIIKANFNQSFLLEKELKEIEDWVPVDLFGISSYKGHTLTFKIHIKYSNSLWDYIPFHLLTWDLNRLKTSGPLPLLELNDLIYNNCPDENIVINKYSYLENKRVNCFFKRKNLWIQGTYLFTVDWYKANENVNIILLDNGQIGAVPNHKLLFNTDKKEFVKYNKIKEEWKI